MSMNPRGWAYQARKYAVMGWLLIAQDARALRLLDGMVARWPDDAYALASRAHLRAQRGDRAGAIADAQSLVAVHPARSAADWFNLAFLLEAEGRLRGGRARLPPRHRDRPKLDRAWYGLGLTLIRLGRHDDAVKALERNTKLQPMSPYGWYQLARVHMDRQQPDEALKIIRHLKGFEPKVAAQLERETGLAA
jgi:predicted Zn-dependent protease